MKAEAEVIDAETEEEPVQPTGKALARREMVAGLIRPVAAPAEVMAVQEETRALIESALKVDRDYGVIPGTKKPTLLKPGAERINAAFACVAAYEIVEREVDHDRVNQYTKRSWVWGQRKGEKIWTEEAGESKGLYRYVVLCRLIHRESGVEIGQGVGSCSTMESKYIDRPRDVENTVLKMAKKRAYVDATLTTFGLSDQFTQDVEDMPHEAPPPARDPHGPSPMRELANEPAKGHVPTPERVHAEQNGTDPLDTVLTIGKHKGKTWRTLVRNHPDYVEWAIEKMERLDFETKEALHAALFAPKPQAVPLSQPEPDDLPF